MALESQDVVAYIGGTAGFLSLLGWAVRTLGGRVVEHEDENRRRLTEELEAAKAAERHISETLIELKGDLRGLKTSVDGLGAQVGKQGAEHDRELGALRREMREMVDAVETRIRQDVQRLIAVPRQRQKSR